VCAIAAPSLSLHKKLAFGKVILSTNSKEHKEKELRGEDKESEVRGGSSQGSRGSPPQLSPSKVVSVCGVWGGGFMRRSSYSLHTQTHTHTHTHTHCR
jgi:hypothetical protein